MPEPVAKTLAIDEAARGGERAHLRDIAGQRYRRRADVMVDLEILYRAAATEVGHRVAVTGCRCPGGSADFDQLLEAHALDDRLEDRERQAHALTEHEAGGLTTIERFHQQLLELIEAETGVFQRDGDRRGRCACRFERCGRRHFLTIGKRTWTNLIAAGPIVTTQIAGEIPKARGNSMFTPVFAAASSARCRRLVRSVSEYTRSDWATLVPNLSV